MTGSSRFQTFASPCTDVAFAPGAVIRTATIGRQGPTLSRPSRDAEMLGSQAAALHLTARRAGRDVVAQSSARSCQWGAPFPIYKEALGLPAGLWRWRKGYNSSPARGTWYIMGLHRTAYPESIPPAKGDRAGWRFHPMNDFARLLEAKFRGCAATRGR